MSSRSKFLLGVFATASLVLASALVRDIALADLGDSQADLVYTPLAGGPCRIIDTRLTPGGPAPIQAGTQRDFRVTGTNLDLQGGPLAGCGVPNGPATAANINFVAVDPQAAGNLRITPFGKPIPTASFINYAPIPGVANFNIANGLVVTICDPAGAVACTSDFRIQADAGTVHLVADVQGFYRSLRREQVKTVGFDKFITGQNMVLPASTFTCTNHQDSAGNPARVTVVAPVSGRVHLQGNVFLNMNHTTGVLDWVQVFIGQTATDCTGPFASFTIDAALPTMTAQHITLPISRVFTVGAGTTSYFVNASRLNGTGSIVFNSSALIATFIPN